MAFNFVDAAGRHRFAARMRELASAAGHVGAVAQYYNRVADEFGKFPSFDTAMLATLESGPKYPGFAAATGHALSKWPASHLRSRSSLK